jgi:hypothetical protein
LATLQNSKKIYFYFKCNTLRNHLWYESLLFKRDCDMWLKRWSVFISIC